MRHQYTKCPTAWQAVWLLLRGKSLDSLLAWTCESDALLGTGVLQSSWTC